MSNRKSNGFASALGALLLAAPTAWALDSDEAIGFERTPPRLAFIDGEVSFWRPGAGDWTPAQVNIALAAGDELYSGDAANLELQVGGEAFVRAGENTQFGLTSLEPDFLQLRVTEGHVSLDLRSRKESQTIEIDTPNAAFTVERTGYYRVEVKGETTTFTSRRGGRATVTTAAGSSAVVAPSEQVVVTGTDAPGVETYAASELDAWDRWNYARTDEQLDAVSARYVPAGVYGVDNLDHHGDWRLVSSYGAVWVPRGVPAGWAPYSTGRWMYDPYYGWTWVDDAPWGWAPYHYGRWVYTSGYWGWCPGRVVVRPYYSPALVAFYGGGGFSVGISFGYPSVGWVALGWGEPVLPWWGPARYRGVPRWGGWGGPRVVNNVVIQQKTVINVREINHYQNARVRDAIVAVDRDHFGRRSGGDRRYTRGDASRYTPVRGDLGVRPDRSSLVASSGEARRPSREVRERRVVAVREPRLDRTPELASPRGDARPSQRRARAESADASAQMPPTRLVQPADGSQRIETTRRPPFGRSGERERRISPPAPSYEEVRREEAARSRRERPRVEDATRPRVEDATRPRVEDATRPEAGSATAAREGRRERSGRPAPAPAAQPDASRSAARTRASETPSAPDAPATRPERSRSESRARSSSAVPSAPEAPAARPERPRSETRMRSSSAVPSAPEAPAARPEGSRAAARTRPSAVPAAPEPSRSAAPVDPSPSRSEPTLDSRSRSSSSRRDRGAVPDRRERASSRTRDLPGEPANRVFRPDSGSRGSSARQAAPRDAQGSPGAVQQRQGGGGSRSVQSPRGGGRPRGSGGAQPRR